MQRTEYVSAFYFRISVRLGFNNRAFFGKFVKKHSGMTPKQLRTYLKTKQ